MVYLKVDGLVVAMDLALVAWLAAKLVHQTVVLSVVWLGTLKAVV